MTEARYTCSFINADTLVVPDTLIDLLLNLHRCYVDGHQERVSSTFACPPMNLSTYS